MNPLEFITVQGRGGIRKNSTTVLQWGAQYLTGDTQKLFELSFHL
jgi:hypothetical protein